jgi:hypothetical protein
MDSSAKILAKGRRTFQLVIIIAILSIFCNIGQGIFFALQLRQRDQMVIFDLATGNLLISQVIDPLDSQETMDKIVDWSIATIEERTPTGLKHDNLIPYVFESDIGKRVRHDFELIKSEYVAKNMWTSAQVEHYDAQPMGKGILKTRVLYQVVTDATVNGGLVRTAESKTLDLMIARNPGYGRFNKKYPLMVFDYKEVAPAVVKK